jgi:type 1 glutamine amidotransferase
MGRESIRIKFWLYKRVLLFPLALIMVVISAGMTCSRVVPKETALPEKAKKRIVFLISEDSLNYDAHKTIPVFAEMLRKKDLYDVTVLLGKGTNNAFSFPGLDILNKTDLVVLFSRRIALPHSQLQLFQNYLKNGGPLVAIRTGNHAFTTRGDVDKDHAAWPEFVSEILGCGNYGYGPVEPGTDVSVAPGSSQHPILKDFNSDHFHSNGNLYRVTPLLDKNAKVLLTGKAANEIQPVAWTRMAGKSRVFYTTLGYPTDFSETLFNTLIINAIAWGINGK